MLSLSKASVKPDLMQAAGRSVQVIGAEEKKKCASTSPRANLFSAPAAVQAV
jgi:hypothetical protein